MNIFFKIYKTVLNFVQGAQNIKNDPSTNSEYHLMRAMRNILTTDPLLVYTVSI